MRFILTRLRGRASRAHLLTYYLNETRNNGGTIGIYFACPS